MMWFWSAENNCLRYYPCFCCLNVTINSILWIGKPTCGPEGYRFFIIAVLCSTRSDLQVCSLQKRLGKRTHRAVERSAFGRKILK